MNLVREGKGLSSWMCRKCSLVMLNLPPQRDASFLKGRFRVTQSKPQGENQVIVITITIDSRV